MKGLLYKDWCQMKHYCRAYLLIAVIFLAVSFADDDNFFFVFYPCLLCGMIPVTLLSIDESGGWLRYSGTLPYSAAQIVSAKFLIGLFPTAAVLLATGVLQTVRMCLHGAFLPAQLAVLLLSMLLMTLLSVALCLPLVFRFGVEKGKIVYYMMIGLFFVALMVFSRLAVGNGAAIRLPGWLLPCTVPAGILLYALSWLLSVAIYKRREV